jgi:hypothetical protein
LTKKIQRQPTYVVSAPPTSGSPRRRRQSRRAPDALHTARDDQPVRSGRRAPKRRRQREEGDPAEEAALPFSDVAEPALSSVAASVSA